MALIETWTDFLGSDFLGQRLTEILKMLQNSLMRVALEEFEKIEKVPLTLFLFICPVAFFLETDINFEDI